MGEYLCGNWMWDNYHCRGFVKRREGENIWGILQQKTVNFKWLQTNDNPTWFWYSSSMCCGGTPYSYGMVDYLRGGASHN